MKVLLVIPRRGRAAHFMAQGIQKYGSHDYEIKTVKEPPEGSYDLVYLMNISPYGHEYYWRHMASLKDVPVVGGIQDVHWVDAGFDVIKSYMKVFKHISVVTWDLKVMLDTKHPSVTLLPPAVDTELFFPADEHPDGARPGWAGNPADLQKQFHWVEEIRKRTPNWQWSIATDLDHEKELPQWFRSRNAFVWTSRNEGCPLAVLEAMATGLPVVSTPCGAVPELLSPSFLGFTPEGLLLKLAAIVHQRRLMKEVGMANYVTIQEKGYAWKQRVHDYEAWFEEVVA